MTIKALFNSDVITRQYRIYVYNSNGYQVDSGIYATLHARTLRAPIMEVTINYESLIVNVKLEEG